MSHVPVSTGYAMRQVLFQFLYEFLFEFPYKFIKNPQPGKQNPQLKFFSTDQLWIAGGFVFR